MRKSIHTSEYAALCEELRAARKKSGLSQRALAARLGVSPSWVAKVETGERRLDVVEFMEFARACGANASKAFDEVVRSRNVPPVGRAKKGGR